jgi:hypothetical protein
VAAHFAKKDPEPKPLYTEKHIEYAVDLLTAERQYDLHHKPDEYTRTLQKQIQLNKSASGSKSSKRSSKKRSYVPQLGEQAKQSIPPLVVSSTIDPQQQDMKEAANLAADMGVTIAELLGEQDVNIPMAHVVPTYELGMPFVTQERSAELPTAMRSLHNWYLRVVKEGRIMIVAKVPEEYYFRPDEIHIDFSELNQLYNFRALDKSIISCYCL